MTKFLQLCRPMRCDVDRKKKNEVVGERKEVKTKDQETELSGTKFFDKLQDSYRLRFLELKELEA